MIYFDFKNNAPITGAAVKAMLGHMPSNDRLADLKIYPYETDESKSDLSLYSPGPVVICGSEDGACVAKQTYVARIDDIARIQEQVVKTFTAMIAAMSNPATDVDQLRVRLLGALSGFSDPAGKN